MSGKSLARLLKKQERALERALKTEKPKAILNAAENSRDVLGALVHAIKSMVSQYVADKGARAKVLNVEFASESDLRYEAKVDTAKKQVRLEMEFDVDAIVVEPIH